MKQTQLDKEQIAEEIADKLGYAPGVSYSEIAKRAADCGRKQLAIKVSLLIYMNILNIIHFTVGTIYKLTSLLLYSVNRLRTTCTSTSTFVIDTW